MPAAAAAAVTGYSSLTAAFAASAYAAVAYAAVYVVTAVAINYGLTRLSQSLAGKQKLGGTTAVRDVTVRGTVEPMQLVYGEILTPGFMAYVSISGANNKFLHYVIVVAAHQCEDITDVYLDSRMIPDADIDGSGDVSTAEFQGEGASRLRILRYLGTRAQTADPDPGLTAWGSNHRGAGVAFLHIRMDGSDEAFPGAAPTNVRALAKGRRLYDPRLDSTNGGSGSHRFANATTWAWSNNAALCRRDYITGGSRWYDTATPEPRLGFGESNARINDTFTIAAANIDDEDVAIPSATTQKRYTCDVQISCGDTHRENLNILESASAGTTGYVNGQYRIYSGAYDTPDVDLGEDDILGPVTVVTHPNGEDLYNLVTGTFFDETRDWQKVPFPNITNSSYETDDRGQYPRKIELHATRSTYRAQRIGILHLALSRNKFTCRFERLSPKAMAIAEHETFTVTISEYGWSSKVFRCLDWEFMPDGFIAITAREESSSSLYADPSTGTYIAGPGGTVTTPAFDEPDVPLNFAAKSMPQGILFTWNVEGTANKNTWYRLYEYTSQTPFSSATEVWSGKGRSVLLQRDGYTTTYFWLVAELNAIASAATPVGNGLAASPGLKGFEDAFADSFEHQDHARFYDVAGSPTITYPDDGITGGKVIQVDDEAILQWKQNIPFDPSALYVLTVTARMTTAPSNAANDLFYCGLAGYEADGTTTTGSLAIAASAFDFGSISLNTWTVFKGYVSGTAASPSPQPAPEIVAPCEMVTDTAFVRPFISFNRVGGDGVMQVDDVRLEKVVSIDGIAPLSVTDNVSVENATDTNLALAFGGAYGSVGSATFVVPANETWRLSVEYQCWALIGVAGGIAGNFRILVNGSAVQEVRTFDDSMASQEHQFSWSYVAEFGAGTHSFTIQGRATSGSATKKHAVVKITGLKR